MILETFRVTKYGDLVGEKPTWAAAHALAKQVASGSGEPCRIDAVYSDGTEVYWATVERRLVRPLRKIVENLTDQCPSVAPYSRHVMVLECGHRVASGRSQGLLKRCCLCPAVEE